MASIIILSHSSLSFRFFIYFLSLIIIIIIIITIISEHSVVSVVIICQFSKLLFASKGMLSMF